MDTQRLIQNMDHMEHYEHKLNTQSLENVWQGN